jgi:soluble calcium-activated nucleotidase 1
LLFLVAITSDTVFSAPTSSVTTNDTASDCRLFQQYINKRYPLTDPILMPDGSVKFRIAIISDLDADSTSHSKSNTWISYFKQGSLTYNAQNKTVSVEWDIAVDNNDQLQSDMSKNGRGLELSELVTFDGRLITLDDKTGLVYVFENNVLIPWVIVVEGDGHQKGGNINIKIKVYAVCVSLHEPLSLFNRKRLLLGFLICATFTRIEILCTT